MFRSAQTVKPIVVITSKENELLLSKHCSILKTPFIQIFHKNFSHTADSNQRDLKPNVVLDRLVRTLIVNVIRMSTRSVASFVR